MNSLPLFSTHPLSSPARSARLAMGILAALVVGLGAPSRAQDNSVPSNFSTFQNTPVTSVLDVYEQLSGLHLVRDVSLNAVPAISINATGLDRAATLRMIESALLLDGVAIVPLDAKTAKVVSIAATRNPRSEGVKLYANAADLPPQDEVVSYYMALNYISPEEAKSIFDQQAPVHSYGSYVPALSAQAIVLTENTSVLRQLIALRELIDVPPATVKTEFIQLHRADAEKVAEILNDLLQGKSSPGNIGLPPGLAKGRGEQGGLVSGTVQIIPDPRSNRLLIASRPTNMPLVRELALQLDQPNDVLSPESRPLKYVGANDILPALEAALAEGKDELTEIKAPTAQNGASGSSGNPAAPAPSQPSGSGVSSGATISAITSPLSPPPENNAPSVAAIGKTRLVADNRSNSIIVFGTPDAVTRVFSIIDELDKKPLQVYLATVIGELTVAEGLEFGIDILQKFQHFGSYGLAASNITGSVTTSSAAVPAPPSLTSAGGFPLFSGLTLYGVIGNTIDAYVRALETTNRFKIVSRPSVYTTNNKLATIATGSEVPIPGNTTSGFTGSSTDLVTSSSIQYQQVLLQLSIIPLINANKEVTLKIRQTNNTLGANTLISGNEVPTINTQEINTEVTVPDKSTIVIGGLISDTNKRTTGGIPFLSDIPLLGYFFKDTQKSKERDELIIMIQPTVVQSDADQIAVNESEKQRTILGKDAADAAAPVTTTTTVRQVTTEKQPGAPPLRTTTQSTSVRTETAAPDVTEHGLPKDTPPPPPPTVP